MPGTSGTSTWLSERLHSTVIIFVIKVIKRTGSKKNDVKNSCSENFFTLFGKVGVAWWCVVFFFWLGLARFNSNEFALVFAAVKPVGQRALWRSTPSSWQMMSNPLSFRKPAKNLPQPQFSSGGAFYSESACIPLVAPVSHLILSVWFAGGISQGQKALSICFEVRHTGARAKTTNRKTRSSLTITICTTPESKQRRRHRSTNR